MRFKVSRIFSSTALILLTKMVNKVQQASFNCTHTQYTVFCLFICFNLTCRSVAIVSNTNFLQASLGVFMSEGALRGTVQATTSMRAKYIFNITTTRGRVQTTVTGSRVKYKKKKRKWKTPTFVPEVNNCGWVNSRGKWWLSGFNFEGFLNLYSSTAQLAYSSLWITALAKLEHVNVCKFKQTVWNINGAGLIRPEKKILLKGGRDISDF